MTVPTNMNNTYETIGIREDLANVIYLVSPEDTPLQTNIGTSNAKGTYHEWQTQDLATAVDTNANLQGDDASLDAAARTVRVGNYTQIPDKTASVSGTNSDSDLAGRSKEMAFQVMTKSLELKRDIEKQLLSNKASVAGATAVAPQSAGFESWLETNVDRGVGGSSGGFSGGIVAAPTDGTTRNFTEALLKSVQADTFSAGGKPTMLFMDGPLKQTFSGFAGISATRVNTTVDAKAQTSIVGGADVYVGDFGTLVAVPHAYGMRATTVLLIDPTKASKAVYRPMFQADLAKNGDSDRKQIIEEYTLQMDNEAAHGVVADVDPV